MKFTFPVYVTVEASSEADGREIIQSALLHRRYYSGTDKSLRMSWTIGRGVEKPSCDCTKKSQTEVTNGKSS